MLAELLRESGFESISLADAESALPERVSLVVAESGSAIASRLRAILDDRRGAVAILLGPRVEGDHPRVRCLGEDGSPDAIREALLEIRRSLDRGDHDAGTFSPAA